MSQMLPPSSTSLERSIDALAGDRLGRLPVLVSRLWNADTCPTSLLPYLAWATSVDEWDDRWSEDIKRAVIREARIIHALKGTPAAIRRALAALGQPDARIVERGNYALHNGSIVRDGTVQRKGHGGWSSYRVVLRRAVTIDQALMIQRLLARVQRNCIELTAVDFKQALLRRNGQSFRNGDYTRGVVNTSIS